MDDEEREQRQERIEREAGAAIFKFVTEQKRRDARLRQIVSAAVAAMGEEAEQKQKEAENDAEK